MDPSPRSSSQLDDDVDAVTFSSRGCCYFCIPRSSTFWQRIRTADDRTRPESAAASRRSKWWSAGVGALMKVREWSEIVAGPRWKTFIRRFNRSSRHHGGGGSGNGRGFGYDPLSYSLNFDGGNEGSPEGDFGYAGFSTRFVAPPASAKSSMDLGGRDETLLFAPPPAVAAVVH